MYKTKEKLRPVFSKEKIYDYEKKKNIKQKNIYIQKKVSRIKFGRSRKFFFLKTGPLDNHG